MSSSAPGQSEYEPEPESVRAVAAADFVRARTWALGLALGLLCVSFFWLQVDYCLRLPLVMDELQGADAVYRLRDQIPYVDFTPYKSVLGYYLQLPFMLLEDDLWSRMIAVKLGMAGLTALVLFACTCALMRVIRGEAVVLATALLLAMSTFLERAAELRVDMPTSLAGFASFVLLLNRRHAWAGLACGVSFLISQKGVFFLAAGMFALFGRGLVLARGQWRWRDALAFTLVASAVIGAYVLAFGVLGHSVAGVTHQVLAKPLQIALADDYKNLARFWLTSVQRNPYFYGLAVLGIGAALERARRERSELDWMIFVYAGTVLALGIGHKQPWPYFFVLLLPTLLVPIARLVEQLSPLGPIFWAGYLLVGLLFPLSTRVPVVLARDNGHQRYTIELAERLLRKDEPYLAGIDMVYTRRQSPEVFAWLDKSNLDLLRYQSSYDLIAELQLHAPKLVIGNYRIDALPIPIRKALRTEYDHLWASVWLYAPTIRDERFTLRYSGTYRLGYEESVQIDGKAIPPGTSLFLKAGAHTTNVTGYKLRYVPSKKLLGSLDIKYRMPADLFPAMYDY